jgi:hypothetical protein
MIILEVLLQGRNLDLQDRQVTSGWANCRLHVSAGLLNAMIWLTNLEHIPLADCDAKVLFDGGMCGNLRTQRSDLVLKRLVLLPQRCVSIQERYLSDFIYFQPYLQSHAASSHVSRTCGFIHQDIAPSWWSSAGQSTH